MANKKKSKKVKNSHKIIKQRFVDEALEEVEYIISHNGSKKLDENGIIGIATDVGTRSRLDVKDINKLIEKSLLKFF